MEGRPDTGLPILSGENLGFSLYSMVTSPPPDRSDVPEKPTFPSFQND